MAEEIPDHYKDPYEDMYKETVERTKKIVPEVMKEYQDASLFSIYWVGQYEDSKYHPEEDAPNYETMLYGEIIKMNYLLIKLLQRLDKNDKD